MTTIARPGLRLASGIAAVVAASVAPVGLREPVSAASWALWSAVFGLALAATCIARGGWIAGARRMAVIVPLVAVISLPMALVAARGIRIETGLAIVARALAATAASVAVVTVLGPAGIVAGLRALKLPRRLVAIAEAMLVSSTAFSRQVSAMLRARAARRATDGPWSSLLRRPGPTVQGFGRFVAALTVRSLERAQAIERAREARGLRET